MSAWGESTVPQASVGVSPGHPTNKNNALHVGCLELTMPATVAMNDAAD